MFIDEFGGRLVPFIGAIEIISKVLLLIFSGSANVAGFIEVVSVGISGALPGADFLSLSDLSFLSHGLKSKNQMVALALAILVLIYELRVVILAILASRSQSPEADLIPSREGDKGVRKFMKVVYAWERRFWLYSLMIKSPSLSSFKGVFHFGTGKQNGNASTWLGWVFVNLVPIPIIHIIIHQRSPLAASITTFACLMGSLWLWAEYRASTIRPVSIDDQFFYLRYGLSVDREIGRDSILEVKSIGYKDMSRRLTKYAGFGSPNVVIALKTGEDIAIGVDSPGLLIEKLRPLASAA